LDNAANFANDWVAELLPSTKEADDDGSGDDDGGFHDHDSCSNPTVAPIHCCPGRPDYWPRAVSRPPRRGNPSGIGGADDAADSGTSNVAVGCIV